MTFTHLLVPLDGTRHAEVALPAAALLAERLHARVTLLHLLESAAPALVHGQPHLSGREDAAAYLAALAESAFRPGTAVGTHVHEEPLADVAGGVAAHVGELVPDLVVLCAHGHRDLKAVFRGRLAQRVVHLATTPVLLLHASSVFTCRHLLVPVDGQPEHARGLEVAGMLARAFQAEVTLFRVVPTAATLKGEAAEAGTLLPSATRAILELERDQVAGELERQAAALRAGGLQVRAVVGRGDPAREILKLARRARADLVVMGTHGRAGMAAFWAGSVADRVALRCDTPLLLVPPAA
jgi:nucleotide-binding universal stress UspA family protein